MAIPATEVKKVTKGSRNNQLKLTKSGIMYLPQSTTPKLQKKQHHHQQRNTKIGTLNKIARALHKDNPNIEARTKTTGIFDKQQHQH